MIRSLRSLTLPLLALLACGAIAADESQTRRYELPNLDTLELVLPAGWADSVDEPPGGAPLTIQLRPVTGPPFEVFVTVEWPEPTAPAAREADALRDTVRDAARRIQPQAVEASIEIRRLQGAQGVGFYFVATDRDPAADGFRTMHQGALQAGDLTLWFTVLTNDGPDDVVAGALTLLQGAVHRRTGIDQH